MPLLMPLLLLLCALAAGGCSLMLDLDEEGLACDEQGHCLEGYACVEGACRRAEALPCSACDGGGGCADAGAACP